MSRRRAGLSVLAVTIAPEASLGAQGREMVRRRLGELFFQLWWFAMADAWTLQSTCNVVIATDCCASSRSAKNVLRFRHLKHGINTRSDRPAKRGFKERECCGCVDRCLSLEDPNQRASRCA